MLYTVKQDFKTPQHFFQAGNEIDGADIDGPVDAASWVALGKIAPVADPAPLASTPKAPKAPERPADLSATSDQSASA